MPLRWILLLALVAVVISQEPTVAPTGDDDDVTAAPTDEQPTGTDAQPTHAHTTAPPTVGATGSPKPNCPVQTTPNTGCETYECSRYDLAYGSYSKVNASVYCYLSRLDSALYAGCGSYYGLKSTIIDWTKVYAAEQIAGYVQLPPGYGYVGNSTYTFAEIWKTAWDDFYSQYESLYYYPLNIGLTSEGYITDSYNTTYRNINTGRCIQVAESYYQTFNATGYLTHYGYQTDSYAVWCGGIVDTPSAGCQTKYIECPKWCPGQES